MLNSLPGDPYRMTSYDRAEVADVDQAYGLQLHSPRFLEYVGAPESVRLLSQPPGHWVRTMEREEAVLAALQLQHDAGLIMSNLQVLGQFVTSLNRMSSEVMRFAFGPGHFIISSCPPCGTLHGGNRITVQITFIFIDFRVCDFAFAFKTQNAPCVSRFKRVLFSDRFQFAF